MLTGAESKQNAVATVECLAYRMPFALRQMTMTAKTSKSALCWPGAGLLLGFLDDLNKQDRSSQTSQASQASDV